MSASSSSRRAQLGGRRVPCLCMCAAAAIAAAANATLAPRSLRPPPALLLQALKEGQRLDGRGPHELRPVRLAVALDDSACTVLLGRTRVMAVVAATLEAPYGDRPSEGSLRFNVEFSPMASPAFAPGARGWALSPLQLGVHCMHASAATACCCCLGAVAAAAC